MSILIKGMEMPKNCDTCWALDDYGDYPRCRITEEQRGYNFPVRKRRMDNCPLIELPPHGRLIDATFEENHYASMLLDPTPDVTREDKHKARIILDALQMAKTVIEEGSEI